MKKTMLLLLLRACGLSLCFGQSYQNPSENAQLSGDSSIFHRFLNSGNYFLLKPGENSGDLRTARKFADKAAASARKSGKQSWQADVNLLYTQIEREGGKPNPDSRLLNDALIYYRSAGNFLGEGNALMEKRKHYVLDESGLEKMIVVVRQAVDAYSKTTARKEEADARRELGDLLQINGHDRLGAIRELKKSLILYREVKFNRLHGVYDLLGQVYSQIGDYEEGLKYNLLALKTAMAVGDSSMQLCTIYYSLGLTYHYINEWEKSFNSFRKAMEVAVRYKDEATISLISINIAILMDAPNASTWRSVNWNTQAKYLLGLPENFPKMSNDTKLMILEQVIVCFHRLNDLKTAQQYINKLQELANKTQINGSHKVNYYSTLIKHGILTKQLKFTEENINLLKKYLEKDRSLPRSMASAHHWSFKLDSLRGDYLSAINNYQKFKTLQDSIFTQKKEAQISKLNVRYDMERKDQELKDNARNIVQLKKQSILQNELLKKAKANRNITVAFLILTVLFLALLYSRYRIKQRSNIAVAAKNQQLQKIINEREWLIRELHHRVKNNLHTIISLLESQSANLSDDALAALKDSQHRVQAMSLIHQKLYLSDKLATINMPNYIWELTEYLLDSFSGQKSRMSLDLDPIDIDVAKAIPIGLILNEAITNALKYAFPDGLEGTVHIAFKRLTEPSEIVLEVADDGIGLPDRYVGGKPGSMGLKLIIGLTGELGGKLSVTNEHGTKIRIEFDEAVLSELPDTYAGGITPTT